MSAYTDFLAHTNTKRLVLLEVDVYDTSEDEVVTRRIASDVYLTGPTDDIASVRYDARLKQGEEVVLDQKMSRDLTGGAVVNVGSVILQNEDGLLDDWLTDSWGQRECRIKHGDPSWTIDQFQTVFTGVALFLAVNNDGEMELAVSDRSILLDEQMNMFGLLPVESESESQNPGAASQTGSGTSWTNTDGIAGGSGNARCDLPNQSSSKELQGSTFGFSVPAGATITGVKVLVDHVAEQTNKIKITHITLYDPDGGSSRKNQGAYLAASAGRQIAGGQDDDWGLDLTVSNVNAAGFKVGIGYEHDIWTLGARWVDVTGVTVVVYYTTQTSGSPDVEGTSPVAYGRLFNITPKAADSDNALPVREVSYKHCEDMIIGDEIFVDQKQSDVATVVDSQDNDDGHFFAKSTVAGSLLTVNAQGRKNFLDDPESWIEKVPDIMVDLLTDSGDYWPSVPLERSDPENHNTSGDIDTSAMTQLASDWPYEIGLYITEPQNIRDTIDGLVPNGWWWGFNASGQFTAKVLSDPSGQASSLTLNRNDTISDEDMAVQPSLSPMWKLMVGYKRNWTVQAQAGQDTTIDDDRLQFIQQEYRTTEAEDSTIREQFRDARNVRLNTIISNKTDAETERDRIATLWNTQRYRYTVACYAKAAQVELGDVVTLKDDRFGLSAGVKMLVVGRELHLPTGRTVLELWK